MKINLNLNSYLNSNHLCHIRRLTSRNLNRLKLEIGEKALINQFQIIVRVNMLVLKILKINNYHSSLKIKDKATMVTKPCLIII